MLWDIDGTVVDFHDVSRDAFGEALSEVAGEPVGSRLVGFSGKTDPQIARETFEAMGVPQPDIDSLVRKALRRVGPELAAVRDRLREEGEILPGVLQTLVRLDDLAVLNTVVTGNLAVNAVLKLDVFRLTKYFDMEIGAYGSDAPDRDRLPRIAIDRAERMRNVLVDDDRVWLIGDTPRDHQAARASSLRCLLVASGRHSYDELAGLGADVVVESLSDVDTIVDLLTS